MIAPRRFLPPIGALLAFEAVARLGSATRAAEELSLTQSAVSRQLKSLEAQLDVVLIAREGRQLGLTAAGRAYVKEVRSILTQLARASVNLRTNPQGGVLNLAILPAFGMHWLAPRLRGFAEAHPEVTLNLSTQLRPIDFATEPFDAAIHFGREDLPGVAYLPLMPEIVVPVAAPSLVPQPIEDPRDMQSLPLLHLESRPRAWARWFRALDVTHSDPSGMVFDQFSTMAQASIHGLGVALLPTFFAESFLESGQLVRASPRTTESIGSYYLVWPDNDATQGPLSSFRDWLMENLS